MFGMTDGHFDRILLQTSPLYEQTFKAWLMSKQQARMKKNKNKDLCIFYWLGKQSANCSNRRLKVSHKWWGLSWSLYSTSWHILYQRCGFADERCWSMLSAGRDIVINNRLSSKPPLKQKLNDTEGQIFILQHVSFLHTS